MRAVWCHAEIAVRLRADMPRPQLRRYIERESISIDRLPSRYERRADKARDAGSKPV